jgi:hypothetical protein
MRRRHRQRRHQVTCFAGGFSFWTGAVEGSKRLTNEILFMSGSERRRVVGYRTKEAFNRFDAALLLVSWTGM